MIRLLALFIVVSSTLGFAAPTKGSVLKIKLRDGKTVVGEVIMETATGYLLGNGGKNQTVLFADVLELDELGAPALVAAPAPAVAEVQQEWRTEPRRQVGKIVLGSSLLAGGYLVALANAFMMQSLQGFQYQYYFSTPYFANYIPVAGPVIQLIWHFTDASRYSTYGNVAADAVFAIVSTAMQVTGLTFLILGLRRTEERVPVPRLSILPAAPGASFGVSLLLQN